MRKFISVFLVLIICFSTTAFAENTYNIDKIVSDTANYICKTVSAPQVGSVGGEWAVIGLARSGADVPEEYYQNYYENVEKYVKEREGILHEKKYTEYSRLVVALTAIGKNPQDVAGYNLLKPLGDYEKTIWQGLNGPVWALLALDSKNYEMPENPEADIQATREMYVQRILDCQLPDGGWSLFGGTKSETSNNDVSDPDITGMALQALSKYQENPKVKSAIEKALNTMSEFQDEKAGFSSFGTENSESCVQMMVALCELGISIYDERFVKNGYTLLDNILTYYNEGDGFSHSKETSGVNLMATEQAFYGIVAVKRMSDGKSSLYRMNDAISVSSDNKSDIKKISVVNPDKTFDDILNHANKNVIEALASRNIISGKSENSFEPDSTMTRAEFATIITRGLGLEEKKASFFTDVEVNDWYYTYVNTAYHYGIIKGVSETEFNPNGTITREEAAVMVGRAANLCGINTNPENFNVRNVLSQFTDYVEASDWSKNLLAFCYKEGILSDEVMEIKPMENVTRAEIADMLYNMLCLAKLI